MITKGRFKTFDFWDGAVFGLAISSIIGLALAWFLTTHPPDAATTLATAAAVPAALFATLIAVWLTRFQIAYQRDQDLAAARAVLPLALTRMTAVANDGILLASGTHPTLPSSLEAAQRLLALDDTIIQTLRDNVRHASDPTTREWLLVIIGRYQVYSSRIPWWWAQPAPVANSFGQLDFGYAREDALIDWATFHSMTSHLYEYARFSAEKVPREMDPRGINSAFFHNIHENHFLPVFSKRIALRVERLAEGDVTRFGFRE